MPSKTHALIFRLHGYMIITRWSTGALRTPGKTLATFMSRGQSREKAEEEVRKGLRTKRVERCR